MDNGKYLVSVITPVFNTRIEFLRRGFEKLKLQKLGFENIEWIVVIHNTREGYLEEMQAMTAGCDNVKLYVLNNDNRTPSSPRNYGMERASGTYVLFMDSDDYLLEAGLEEVVHKTEEKQSDIAIYRAQTAFEDHTVLDVMDTRVRFDQTGDCIEIKKGDPELYDLAYEGVLTIWCKLFRREFLNKNNLRFSVDIKQGEDVCFSMLCMKKVESLLILPQTIVYVYYMNHTSLSQKTDHTPESLLILAREMASIFDVMIEGGFGIEKLGWPIMRFVVEMVIYTPGITVEEQETIKKLMKRYFDIMKPMEADSKFFDKKTARQYMQRVKMILLGENLDDTDEMALNLLAILQNNADTEYGKKYQFKDIDSIEKYQSSVPLTDYRTYIPYVKLMTKIGETNIICADKVVSYSLQEVEDGVVFQVPQTESVIDSYWNIFTEALHSTAESTFLLMNGVPEREKEYYKDKACSNSIFGMLLDRLRTKDVFNSHEQACKYGKVTGPEELYYLKNTIDIRYAQLLFALADEDVSQIFVPHIEELCGLMEYLQQNWRTIAEDLNRGIVSEEAGLPERLRQILSIKLQANPQRAHTLTEIFTEGFNDCIVKLWPKLDKVHAILYGDVSEATAKLTGYFGKIPIEYSYLACEEAFIGKSAGTGQNEYMLMDNGVFFEFLQQGETADGKEQILYNSKMLETRRSYEIVITNTCGFYRFKSGVMIEVSKMDREKNQVFIKYRNRGE